MMRMFAEDLPREFRYAVRSLRRSPGFTLSVLLTLSLGIGATSAVFTIFHAVVLAAPPYPQPDRLLTLGAPGEGLLDAQTGQVYLFLRDRLTTVEHVAAQQSTNGWNLRAADLTLHVDGLQVSEEYFAAHGEPLLLGRSFHRDETEPLGPNAIVISEDLWRRVFASRSDVLGQIVELGEVEYAIVGVAPRGFRSIPRVDVFTPLRTTTEDNSANYRILARLRDGQTAADAAAEFDRVRGEVLRAFPRTNRVRLATTAWRPLGVVLGERLRQPLLLVLGAVLCLLLIACVNTAGLQLTRALANHREAVTRAAIGATPGRLVRQAAAESLVFAVGGSIAGIALGTVLTRLALLLVSEQMAREMAAGAPIGLNPTVMVFTVIVSVVTTMLSGIVPAALSARANARQATGMVRSFTPSRSAVWARRTLTLTEVALCTVLLVGSGLLLRTLDNLHAVDLGFDPERLVIARMSLQGAIDPARLESFLSEGVERVRQIPGVTAVAVSNGVPVERALNIPFKPPPGSLVTNPKAVDLRYVTSGYFATFRIPLLAGRSFDETDRLGRPMAVIVNEAFARAYFGRTDVVGERTSIGSIVGVVANVKARSGSSWRTGANALSSATAPEIFLSAAPAAALMGGGPRRTFDLTWAVRTRRITADIEREFHAALGPLETRAAIVSMEPMSDVIARDIDLERLVSLLLTAFAVVGASLAAVGLYGVTAYAAAQRTREIGVRVALGATTRRIVGDLVSEGVVVSLAGLIIGLAGAAVAGAGLQRLLFGVRSLDASTFASAALVLLLLAAGAAGAPALRAAGVDPVTALKE
jgi:predicted permease